MTKRELAKCLGYCEDKILRFFQRASKADCELGRVIKLKSRRCKNNKVVDFTYEEIMFIVENAPELTPMQVQYVRDNFIHRDDLYYSRIEKKQKMTKDEKAFLKIWSPEKNVEVCNTCMYLQARKMRYAGSKLHPYCTFYKFFLARQKPAVNVYKDRCETYRYNERNDCRIWSQVDNKANNGKRSTKTLGIENSEFISRRAASEPIVILSDGRKNYEDFENNT